MHSVKKILHKPAYFDQKEYIIKGWVVSNRGNKKVRFLSINDGSTIKSMQVIFKDQSFDFELLDKLKNGSGLVVKGILKETPQAKQPIELEATQILSYSIAHEDYPIQNQEIKLETLRELPHLRHRTNLLRAIMLIRSTLAHEVHRYFMQRDFYYMNSPIITSNDGEGAGETFSVDDTDKDPFFGKDKKATLGVTGQLHGESAALGMQKIYTFAPTFRAEKSNTKRHLAEFWMIEPEVAFYNLYDDITLADDLLKVVIRNTIFKHKDEMQYLNDNLDNNLLSRINEFLNTPLKIVEYTDAINQLAQVKQRFENQDIKFGLDLATEHEKYLTEVVYKAPIAVINFPKEFKAFYMKQNDDGKTVASFDLLVPGVGELVGGSQRENDIEKLTARIDELGINKEDLKWYLDLRRFGNVSSAGFGIGFERLVMYVTGAENIRDVIPYPRTAGNIRM
ncbi:MULTISPECIES: asparagine--tRNA ligase [unclassified Mycoplasma]|uniref:asparagine--tRNA ligase n=1 Tax=unclassified Mycoplasma TaxID=2683645 RepID=UPI00211D1538|nr:MULTISPECIES: asparagine--tRNA ligase [unclassified Mycoplasma]UUM19765.1 asparagine--tRNA ligase [Mycoplasma sp. 1578d]UUM24748.1 asparagine--tRNA ligase [Mycoplasma sp. 3686d]